MPQLTHPDICLITESSSRTASKASSRDRLLFSFASHAPDVGRRGIAALYQRDSAFWFWRWRKDEVNLNWRIFKSSMILTIADFSILVRAQGSISNVRFRMAPRIGTTLLIESGYVYVPRVIGIYMPPSVEYIVFCSLRYEEKTREKRRRGVRGKLFLKVTPVWHLRLMLTLANDLNGDLAAEAILPRHLLHRDACTQPRCSYPEAPLTNLTLQSDDTPLCTNVVAV
ncbi:hypothetical protein NL676_010897 [Syzygium grande]|nr:hypothetical protein NL676_010897 [Syzygium grande]